MKWWIMIINSLFPIFTSIMVLSLGLLTLARNPKSRTHIVFFLLTLASALWLPLNFFGGVLTENIKLSIYIIHADFFIGTFIPVFFYLFGRTVYKDVDDDAISSREYLAISVLGALLAFGSFSPEVLSIHATAHGTLNITEGALYIAYSIPLLVLISLGLFNLVKARSKSKGSARAQTTVILASLALAGFIVGVPNLVLPSLVESPTTLRAAQQAGLSGFLIFAGGSAYAIIKHRMFDIRLVVARSVAYTMLVITLSIMYALSVFGFSSLFSSGATYSSSQLALNTVIAVVLVFTFQPLKQFFDRITKKIFYRDAYDSQKVINHLSEVLASEMKLVRIARKSLALIVSNLHLTYGLFIVVDEDEIYEMNSYGDAPEDRPDITELHRYASTLTIMDELKDGKRKNLLQKYNAAVILKLKTKEGIVGYILLGHKASGNIYTEQDIKFLRIVANELSIAVENSRNYEQIQAFNETLQKKVDDATKKLRDTNKKLRKLDEAKDEFITMASHQLRTPLTTIKGYVSMMLEGDAGKITKKQRDMLKAAYTSSDRMVYLIADLLNVSRLSTGKFVIQPKRINLADIVRSEIDQLERHFEAKNIKAVFKSPENMPPVELDENKTRQVIMNFIDNAIFYTQEDGEIDVTLEEKEQSIELRVKDNGIGVPKEEQHKLFTKFFRATNAKKARPDGTGLGLYLAKKVVTAQGGTIIFESEEGEGSTFGFSFPKDRILIKSSDEKKPAEPQKAMVA